MRSKRVLVAPLDWGLGHASRCVPVIEALLKDNHEVLLASSGQALRWLKTEFPLLKTYELPAYNPVYPQGDNMVFKMALQLPKFIAAIKAEHEVTQKIVNDAGVEVVISDNRYGCYSARAKSVLMTHQANVLMPAAWKFAQPILNRFNHAQIKKFDACWIPAPAAHLFPELMSVPFPVTYIGFLSRFKKQDLPYQYDLMAICTGPEPQRSIFESLVTQALKQTSLKCILVQSKVEAQQQTYTNGNLIVFNYLNSEAMGRLMQESLVVISRSGYSTIMDLMKLNKRSVLVPTPGQTEQEYLGHILYQQKLAYCVAQKEFNFPRAWEATEQLVEFQNYFAEDNSLQNAIQNL
ncbi:MAG: glycosyltransferase [Bacteroidetes bacterium]|nr:glycosyltransferase [Bacteroidota bacterium]